MKKRFSRTLALLLAACVAFGGSMLGVSAQGTARTPARLIVELEGAAVLACDGARLMGAEDYSGTAQALSAARQLDADQQEVLEAILRQVDPDAEVVFSYTHLFNGFSLEGALEDMDAIRALPGVKDVYLSQSTPAPDPIEGSDQEVGLLSEDSNHQLLDCCLDMRADYLHDLDYKGQGQVVAVIDSELDTDHEFFAGEVADGPLTRNAVEALLSQYSFNVEVTAQEVYRSSKLPFVYDYGEKDADTHGSNVHGSHVSGIAVGRGGTLPSGSFTGVAPEAQLVFMKVANASGGLLDDAVLAAMDDAAKLGVCAINLSLGLAGAYRNPGYEQAVANAQAAGILVSAAAGNSSRGSSGLAYADMPDYETGGVPDCLTGSLSVASSEGTGTVYYYYPATVNGETIRLIQCFGTDNFIETFSGQPAPYVYCGRASEEDMAQLDLTGKIAVIDRDLPGTPNPLTFTAKAQAAEGRGAAGIIYINYSDAVLSPLPDTQLPYTAVIRSDGDLLLPEGGDGAGTLEIAGDRSFDQLRQSAPSMSSFSSWGTNLSLELKPEITAPGGGIYSSLPGNQYGNENGTSMAAPHVTGAAALLNQYISAHPERYANTGADNRSLLMENLLMTSAKPVLQDNGLPASPRQQGAGLVDLEGAVNTPLLLTGTEGKAKISLKEIGSSFTLEFTAKNFTDQDRTYTPSLFVFTDDARESDGRYQVTGSRGLTYQAQLPDHITVPAGETVAVSIPVTLDEAELAANGEIFSNGFFVDGFVVLTDQGDGPELSIPYTGFYGDWDSFFDLGEPVYVGAGRGSLYLSAFDPSQGCVWTATGLHACPQLGRNQTYEFLRLLNADLSAYTEADYAGAQFAGLSPNGDGEMDDLCVYLSPSRLLKDVSFTLRAADGHTVGTFEYNYFHRLATCLDLIVSDLADGDYTLTLTASLDLEDAQPEEQVLPFYVDTQAPVIRSTGTREEAGRTYLDLALSDNRYLMSAILFTDPTQTLEGLPLSQIRLLNTDAAQVSFDITGLDIEDLEVAVMDYAGNGSRHSFAPAPEDSGGGDTRPSYYIDLVSDGNGSLSASQRNAHSGETITVTASPKPGYGLQDLTVTTRTGEEVSLTALENGSYTFVMPACAVEIKATFGEAAQLHQNPFADVSQGDYFYDGVLWAIGKGITSGVSSDTFAPDRTCTRAQILTFLWRAAGSPAPKATQNAFTDVEGSAYYADAVAWALEQGITSGSGAGTLDPDGACTRAQILTFLWRAAGSPAPESAPSTFADVAGSAYYADAVAWALEQGITSGSGAGTFSPDASCTRGQAVTFLYRSSR